MAGKVTVGCKIPNGLKLRIFQMKKTNELVMGGGTREVEVAEQVGDVVAIKGYALPFNMQSMGLHVGGYALTPGVDADFWKTWLAQNRENDIVKNNLIFAQAKNESARAQAKEQKDVWDGMSPMVPDKDRRTPRGQKGIKIETANMSE